MLSTSASALTVAILGVLVVDGQSVDTRVTSPIIATRAAAVEELVSQVEAVPSRLQDEALQATVVGLLEAENAVVAQNYQTFLQTKATSLDEVYAEYYSRVLGLADRLRKESPPRDAALLARLLNALVMGSYNPDSAFADGLALEGDAIVPIVLAMANSPIGPSRWNAYALMARMSSGQDAGRLAVPLSAESQVAIRRAAREGLLDPAPDVRIWAIAAVVAVRDREAIPLLRQLALTDPDLDKGPTPYSVRSAAATALQKLR